MTRIPPEIPAIIIPVVDPLYTKIPHRSKTPKMSVKNRVREKRSKLFLPENGLMLSARPSTIAREPGGKNPSQHDYRRLHGQQVDRCDQTQDFPQKMTLSFLLSINGL